MSKVSQNGWPVFERGNDPGLVAIPKIVGRVRAGDVAVIFEWLIEQFDQTVEDVDMGADEWGWAPRPVRGSTDISNHASGTAIDLNAMRHPIGVRNTFSPAQRARIRALLAMLKHVVRWGGDYSGRPDEMHFEINATAAQVKAVADIIRNGGKNVALEQIDIDRIVQGILGYKNPKLEKDDLYALIRRARDAATKVEALDKKVVALDKRITGLDNTLQGIKIDARDAVREGRARDVVIKSIVANTTAIKSALPKGA